MRNEKILLLVLYCVLLCGGAGTGIITDDMILKSTNIIDYPLHENGVSYEKGDVLRSQEGLFFEVVASHVSHAAYPIETTFAYYRLIEMVHAGTFGDPIPYPENAGIVVKVDQGKYYSYRGEIYLAKADMPHCVWPPGTAGMWQWEKV